MGKLSILEVFLSNNGTVNVDVSGDILEAYGITVEDLEENVDFSGLIDVIDKIGKYLNSLEV